MEYCCLIWSGAPDCLELLDRLQKQICRTFGSSLAASLEPLGHCQNEASLSLFYRYYFGRCLSKLTQLVPLPYSWGRSTHYSDRLHFSVTIPTLQGCLCQQFFPPTAKHLNFLGEGGNMVWKVTQGDCMVWGTLERGQHGMEARLWCIMVWRVLVRENVMWGMLMNTWCVMITFGIKKG